MDEHFSRSDGVGGRGLLVLALIIVSLLGLMAFVGGTGSVTSEGSTLGVAEQAAPAADANPAVVPTE